MPNPRYIIYTQGQWDLERPPLLDSSRSKLNGKLLTSSDCDLFGLPLYIFQFKSLSIRRNSPSHFLSFVVHLFLKLFTSLKFLQSSEDINNSFPSLFKATIID